MFTNASEGGVVPLSVGDVTTFLSNTHPFISSPFRVTVTPIQGVFTLVTVNSAPRSTSATSFEPIITGAAVSVTTLSPASISAGTVVRQIAKMNSCNIAVLLTQQGILDFE